MCSIYTHTHPFNGPLSWSTRVSRYLKGKTSLDFAEARDSEWQWHHLGHMQVCTSLQTDNHTSTPTTQFFTGRMPFLPPNQQRQSTEGKNWNMQYTCWQKLVGLGSILAAILLADTLCIYTKKQFKTTYLWHTQQNKPTMMLRAFCRKCCADLLMLASFKQNGFCLNISIACTVMDFLY